jgi:hypothetical protein
VREKIMTKPKNSKKSGGSGVESSPQPAPQEIEELKRPTDLAALADGPSYVRAVASQVDLVGVSARLVISTDPKIAKAELDRLRELIFGKGGPPQAEETLQIDWSAMTRCDSDVPGSNGPNGFNGQGQGEPRDHN